MMPWRPMTSQDLDDVQRVADEVHVDHPEDREVFEDRLHLYGHGCHVLAENGRILGYAIAHPWRFAEPPPLNARLREIPNDATTYYIHDVALLPNGRGRGHAATIGNLLAVNAQEAGFTTMSLVAVNGSQTFWERLGFRRQAVPGLATKLLSYGSDAALMVRDLTEASGRV
jgi:ribosomal protein S18 acetylase RimI-like enzyme